MARFVVRVARQALLAVLFVGAALLGIASGVVFVFAEDLPQISALDDFAPSAITRVLAADGEVIGEFAIERRVMLTHEEIAPVLRQAIIAAEDETFDSHFGLSIPRIIVTLIRDFIRQEKVGASTLTQQLAKQLFLTPEKTWSRKVKEALLAIQLEKRYTKQEIFTLYANQIPLGHGTYGVEAASRFYFGKSAKDLSLDEAALLAGMIQAPARQSPYVNLDNARRRRNYALGRMADAGFVPREQAEEAMKRPIVTAGDPRRQTSFAPYFLEEIRKHLEANYGAKPLYEGGLTVNTTLDSRLQRVANRAVEQGLRRLDKRRGYRKPTDNVLEASSTLQDYDHARWRRSLNIGDVVPALVMATNGGQLNVRVGRRSAVIGPEGYSWTRRKTADQVARPGDLVSVRVTTIEGVDKMTATLDQEPIVEGALLAIENRTGRILAMVGGYDFERSKFNRATQAYRQIGSTFKAFVYTTAIDRGFTAVTTLVDEPVSYSAGAGQPLYSPSNYDKKYQGPMTLRRALELSRNVPAVRMMNELGPAQVITYARRFGLQSPMEPYLSLALGAAEATLVEMTSAFSVFPHQGVRMEPFAVVRVNDRQDDVLEENRPESRDTIRADTAYVMTSLFRGVVQRGTAGSANALNWPLGGKTGTTDDFTDAWMIGFDPDITVGVWLGHDQKKALGNGESGTVAALPIWIEFMKAYIEGRQDKPDFPAPGNIVRLSVDSHTGQETIPGTPGTIDEVFISGTQPGAPFQRAASASSTSQP